jgi:hypothetical protein
MMMLRTIALSFVLAAGVSACGDDDDDNKDTNDTTEVSDGEITPDATEVTPDATEPDGTTPDATETTPDATEVTPDVTETTDGEVIEPPPTFATFVIDMVQSQSNTTDPVPFADFSTLDEDDSEDAFSTVTFP